MCPSTSEKRCGCVWCVAIWDAVGTIAVTACAISNWSAAQQQRALSSARLTHVCCGGACVGCDQTGHRFSVELKNQCIWDYEADGYAHRLWQRRTNANPNANANANANGS